MGELINRLGQTPGVMVRDTATAWILLIETMHTSFEVTVPVDVLEWYVAARNRQGAPLWHDWVDYKGYDADESVPALSADMRADIERFVRLAVAAEDFQVIEAGRLSTLKTARWKQTGQWCDVWPAE